MRDAPFESTCQGIVAVRIDMFIDHLQKNKSCLRTNVTDYIARAINEKDVAVNSTPVSHHVLKKVCIMNITPVSHYASFASQNNPAC